MKRIRATLAAAVTIAVAVGVAAAVASAAPSRAGADPDECTGVPRCVPVKGPWVKVATPVRGADLPTEWLLACAGKNDIVGGTDARASARTVTVTMDGITGSPIKAGITTHNEVLFTAFEGGGTRAPVSFRPAIGCIPGQQGGGAQSRVSYQVTYPPYTGIDARTEETEINVGSTTKILLSCQIGGRLLHASSAIGFHTRNPPPDAVLRSASATQSVSGDTVTVTVSATKALPFQAHATLQVRIICTRGLQ